MKQLNKNFKCSLVVYIEKDVTCSIDNEIIMQ